MSSANTTTPGVKHGDSGLKTAAAAAADGGHEKYSDDE
jgi:hypothetical protein